jgi:hypothetical protein
MSALVICVVLDCGREEGIDEGGLAKSGFSSNLRYISVLSLERTHSPEMPTMIVKAAPLFATILCRWLGRLAIPIGDALSAVGDIVGMVMGQSDDQDSMKGRI